MLRRFQGNGRTPTRPSTVLNQTPPCVRDVDTRTPWAFSPPSHTAFHSTRQAPSGPYECARAGVTPPPARGRAADERARPAAPDGRSGPSAPVMPELSPVPGFVRPEAQRPRKRTPASPTRSAPGCQQQAKGSEPGRSGKAHSPAREPTCGDRHLLLQSDAAVCTHGDVMRHFRKRADPPVSQISLSHNHGLRPR